MQYIVTSSVILILSHIYSLDKYVNVHLNAIKVIRNNIWAILSSQTLSQVIVNTFRTIRMRLGCILVLIGVLFAFSRAYIHHTSTLMRLNGIKVTWNEFCHYNMRKVGQN